MPFQAMRLRSDFSIPTRTPSYIGGTFAVDQSGSTVTLAVPSGATGGDTCIVILRCRADRTMSGFSGWTTNLETSVIEGFDGNASYTMAYVLSKELSAETSFSFTQSSASAYGAALLVFRDGVIVGGTYTDGLSSSITKVGANSLLLAVGFSNGTSDLGTDSFAGYTTRGITAFTSGLSFFAAFVGTKSGVAAGPTSATGEFQPVPGANGAWLAEIA